METNIQKRTSQQTLQPRVLAKQNPDSKTQQASKPIRILPSRQASNHEACDCQRGRRQGRSLKICLPAPIKRTNEPLESLNTPVGTGWCVSDQDYRCEPMSFMHCTGLFQFSWVWAQRMCVLDGKGKVRGKAGPKGFAYISKLYSGRAFGIRSAGSA